MWRARLLVLPTADVGHCSGLPIGCEESSGGRASCPALGWSGGGNVENRACGTLSACPVLLQKWHRVMSHFVITVALRLKIETLTYCFSTKNLCTIFGLCDFGMLYFESKLSGALSPPSCGNGNSPRMSEPENTL